MELIKWCRNEWERALAILLTIVGSVVMILGWFRISGVGLVSQQLPYIVSAGLGGLFLLGIGATLWISADLHDEWRRIDDLERRIDGTRVTPESQQTR